MFHVEITCRNHTNLRWSCKSIAWDPNGYNGQRNLFYVGTVDAERHRSHSPECKCPMSDLVKVSK